MFSVQGDLTGRWVSIEVSNTQFESFSFRFDEVIGLPGDLFVAATLANDHQLTIQTTLSDVSFENAGVRWTDQILRSVAALQSAIVMHFSCDRISEMNKMSWVDHKIFKRDVNETERLKNDLIISRSLCPALSHEYWGDEALSALSTKLQNLEGYRLKNDDIRKAVYAAFYSLLWHFRLLDGSCVPVNCSMEHYRYLWRKAVAIDVELQKYVEDKDILSAAVAALIERTDIQLSIQPRGQPDAAELIAFILFGPDREDFDRVLIDRKARAQRIVESIRVFGLFFQSLSSRKMKEVVLGGLISSLKSSLSDSLGFDFAILDNSTIDSVLQTWSEAVNAIVTECRLIIVSSMDNTSSTCLTLRCMQALTFHLNDDSINHLYKQSFLDYLAQILFLNDHRIRAAAVMMIEVFIQGVHDSLHPASMHVHDALMSILISKIGKAAELCRLTQIAPYSMVSNGLLLAKSITISSFDDCFTIGLDARGSFSLSMWLWLPISQKNGNILVLEGTHYSKRSIFSFGVYENIYSFSFDDKIVNTGVIASFDRWQHIVYSVDVTTGDLNLILDGTSCFKSNVVPNGILYNRMYIGHTESIMSLGHSVMFSLASVFVRKDENTEEFLSDLSPSCPHTTAFLVNRSNRTKIRVRCGREDVAALSFGVARMRHSGWNTSCVFGRSEGTIGVHFSDELSSLFLQHCEIMPGTGLISSFPYFGGSLTMDLVVSCTGKIVFTIQEDGLQEYSRIEYDLPFSPVGMLLGVTASDFTAIQTEALCEEENDLCFLKWDFGISMFGYPAAFSSECALNQVDTIALLGCLLKQPFERTNRTFHAVSKSDLSALCENSSSVFVRLSASRYLAHLAAATCLE